jgi:hypothetical protein
VVVRYFAGRVLTEVDSRRESSSCLGDGLGHAQAAMVGPVR